MVVFNVFYLFWTYKVKILQNILSGSLQQFPVLACPILQRKQLPGTCWLGLRQSRNSNKWNTLVALHAAKESHARRTHFHPAQPKWGALCSCRYPRSLFSLELSILFLTGEALVPRERNSDEKEVSRIKKCSASGYKGKASWESNFLWENFLKYSRRRVFSSG